MVVIVAVAEENFGKVVGKVTVGMAIADMVDTSVWEYIAGVVDRICGRCPSLEIFIEVAASSP